MKKVFLLVCMLLVSSQSFAATKAELYQQILGKTGVEKIGVEVLIEKKDNVAVYDVPIYYVDNGVAKKFTQPIHVYAEGEPEEAAYLGNNPTIEEKGSFESEVITFLKSKVTDDMIKAYRILEIHEEETFVIARVYVINVMIEQRTYLITKKNGSIVFTQISNYVQ